MALITVFLVLIALPCRGMILGFDRSFVLEENRNLATRPELKLTRASLGDYPAKARSLLQRSVRLPQAADPLARHRESEGLGGHLDARRHPGQQRLAVPRERCGPAVLPGTQPFTPEELEQYQKILEARRDWLAERGIPYLFVIPPNKDTIYPEFMPPAYTKVRPKSRARSANRSYEGHIQRLRSSTSGRTCGGPRSVSVLYDLTDTTGTRGARSSRTSRSCRRSRPGSRGCTRCRDPSSATSRYPLPGGDLARMLGLPAQMPESRLGLAPLQARQARQTDEVFPLPAGFEPYRITIGHGARQHQAAAGRDVSRLFFPASHSIPLRALRANLLLLGLRFRPRRSCCASVPTWSSKRWWSGRSWVRCPRIIDGDVPSPHRAGRSDERFVTVTGSRLQTATNESMLPRRLALLAFREHFSLRPAG